MDKDLHAAFLEEVVRRLRAHCDGVNLDDLPDSPEEEELGRLAGFVDSAAVYETLIIIVRELIRQTDGIKATSPRAPLLIAHFRVTAMGYGFAYDESERLLMLILA